MITIKRKLNLTRSAHGRRHIAAAKPTEKPSVKPGRIPRISRLMALAIRLEHLLQTGEVDNLTELARLGHVSQPRMSQILSLALLAPDIQEELLFLPRVTTGKPTINEKMLRPIVSLVDWHKQKKMWDAIKKAVLKTCSDMTAGL